MVIDSCYYNPYLQQITPEGQITLSEAKQVTSKRSEDKLRAANYGEAKLREANYARRVYLFIPSIR